MSAGDTPKDNKLRWTFITLALLVLGLLILIPSMIVTWLVAAEETDPDIIGLVVAGGSVPIAAGAALVCAAMTLRPRAAQGTQVEPHWTIVSGALFVLGLLMLFPASSCTVIFGGMAVAEGVEVDNLSTLFSILFAGGLPIAGGAALIYAARKMRARS